MKQNKIVIAKKISFFSFIILLIIALIHIALDAIALYNSPYTSFPWYSAFFYVGMFYVIPLIILFSSYLYFFIRSKK